MSAEDPGRRAAISVHELAFVRDVLIPRAWVQGTEVDELLHLRARIDGIFATLRDEQTAPADASPPAATPGQFAPPPERTKKPRHPKRRPPPHPPTPGP